MRRAAVPLALLLLTSTAFAQTRQRPEPGHRAPASSAPGQRAPAAGAPPHAWLFGVWTGGLFPVLDGMSTQDCKAQPTVVFGRDSVGHATLLGTQIVQRVIETVRTTPTGAEFRFTPGEDASDTFGCEDPNVLHVDRGAPDTVTFPNCSAFPYPLHRCGA
ncbi:hypothetical protein [Acidisphaera sp. L21]|uniref:hypothetical protein n=1 Tax=Acidisphaera sp. L21 TaxID=1641851 RepID=UPI00131D244A|nr:hypothetical protein [Acidisphaera sp. L21]